MTHKERNELVWLLEDFQKELTKKAKEHGLLASEQVLFDRINGHIEVVTLVAHFYAKHEDDFFGKIKKVVAADDKDKQN